MALKVTLIGHYPPPYGGVATLMAQMEAALSKAGARVTVMNLGHGRPEGEHILNLADRNRAREVFAIRKALAESDSDVFHYISASYRSFWLAAVCLVLARTVGKKMVVSFVGGAFADFIGSLGPAKRAAARFALSRAAMVLPCNDEIARVVLDLVPGKATRRVSNTFPFELAAAGPLPADVERFVEEHTPLVSSTGAASIEYGLVPAVEAIGQLRARHPQIGMVLVLTRYGNAAYEEELRRAVESEPAGGSVLLARDLPDFVTLLARSDAFLRSTLVDGDSISVREALALGLPTVASDTPFRPEGVLLYRKDNVEDMIDKLSEALERGRADASVAREEAEANLATLLDVYASAAGGI